MSGENDPKNLDGKVVWDVTSGGEGPVVKNGVFYPQRRSFLASLGGAALMLVGVLTGRSYARAAGSAAAGYGSDHSDYAGCQVHNDSPARHVDVPSEVAHADMDTSHSDSHCDSPHGDHNDHHDHADQHVDQ